MKSFYSPQERIHFILNKIDEQISSIKEPPLRVTPVNIKATRNNNNIERLTNPVPPIVPVSRNTDLANAHIPKPIRINKNAVFNAVKMHFDNLDDEKINEFYKQRAVKAYKQRKIFTIYGNYMSIRKALWRRGWVEKCAPGRLQKFDKYTYTQLLKSAKKGNEYEMAVLSKLVQCYPPNLIWQPKYCRDTYLGLTPLRNRVRRTRCLDFSTKIGLIACLENSHWNTIEDVAETRYMPSYKLSCKDDEMYFLEDFRLTQIISVLIFMIECKTPTGLFNPYGAVPTNVLDFAISRIEEYCNYKEQEDMTTSDQIQNTRDWESFSQHASALIKKSYQIIGTEDECSYYMNKIEDTIKKAKVFKPHLLSYGFRNLWILKPGFQCRGQGIVIMDNFYNIVNFAARRSKANYVVQKYIERPFLVYNTKFDIRQYMLLTIRDCISIWMYKDCYLRFSSKEFSLDDLRESVHITNNSIQKKYRNCERDSRLPACNMWALSDFQNYLSELGHNGVWSTKIYPELKKSVVAVVLASLEETDLTPNSFEIYGCDFMLDERLEPFLIEINSTPDMSASTPVTARMCPVALEDVLKVILDYSGNTKTSTGKFELIHQLPCPRFCNNVPELVVEGTTKKLHIPISLGRRSRIKKFIKKKILRKQRSSKSQLRFQKPTFN